MRFEPKGADESTSNGGPQNPRSLIITYITYIWLLLKFCLQSKMQL